MAKIAARFAHQNPAANPPRALELASGDGWRISDIVCEAGPHNRPFEERHSFTSVAVVASGSFQYRGSTGHELLTPGSLLLANAGDCFCCSHDHGTGDRCIAFSFTPEFFERAAGHRFLTPRIPPIRATAPLVVKALSNADALVTGASYISGEELCVAAAGQASGIVRGAGPSSEAASAATLARVTRVIRTIDHEPQLDHSLGRLAQTARLSPYHLLRVFEGITGTTPHQYVLRTRLRRAAVRLKSDTTRILDIALDCGFGDVSNFNRAFRAEFGVSPRLFRAT